MPKKNTERKKVLDHFFGELNYESHRDKSISYKSVIDKETIIIRTDNFRYIDIDEHTVQPVLIVGLNKAQYLKPWQYKKISYIQNSKRHYTYAIKLKKNYFNPSWFIDEFKDVTFSYDDDWDSLYQTAIAQEISGIQIYI